MHLAFFTKVEACLLNIEASLALSGRQTLCREASLTEIEALFASGEGS